MTKKLSINDITGNVCGALIDIILWQVALVGASVGKSGPRGVHQAFKEADDFLMSVNHNTLAAAWHSLFKKKLLTYRKRGNLYSPAITEYGKKRITETIPTYKSKRPWDKRIYLITYDIPEVVNAKRDKLRNFLKRINACLLQESTWVMVYNLRQLIADFVKENKIPGTIIVSDIGKDGGIGEENITDLLVRLFSLEKLNERYEDFIQKSKKRELPERNLIFQYLSILKDDPQLPFEILPKGWLGNKAFLVYQKLNSQYVLNLRSRLVNNTYY